MPNTKIKKDTTQRILVVTLSNLGDVILTTPVLSVLHYCFPKAILTVLVDQKAKALLERCDWVKAIAYDKNESRLKQFLRCMALRKERFDLVVDLRHTLIPLLVGAKHRSSIFRTRQLKFMREQHLDRLRELGLEIPSHIPTFDFFNHHDLEVAKRILLEAGLRVAKPFMVVVPGARYPLKSWDADRFGEIARQTEENLKRKVVILGSQNESEAARIVASKSSAINLCGKLPIEQSAAVISMAELVLSNDSALMHMANALNIPCVSLFGPTNRAKYGFESEMSRVIQQVLPCVPCEKAVCQIKEKRKCMNDISVTKVFSEIKYLFQQIKKVSS